MQVNLKEIVDQLTEAVNLENGFKVAALVNDEKDNAVVGWRVVKVEDDGSIKPVDGKAYHTIKELIEDFK